MGPMIDEAAALSVERAWSRLVSDGGRPVVPLIRPRRDGPFLSPAIIDVTDIDDRSDEEIFGPLLQMVRVPDFGAAIREANATRYGLAATLIGENPALYDQFWAASRAGIVSWNRVVTGAPSGAPLGGIGLSGNHRPGAHYAADHCAYPVASLEAEHARAMIGIGLSDS